MVAYNDPDKETIEDQSRAPLVLAIPYTSIDMRKVERSSKMTQEESKMADSSIALTTASLMSMPEATVQKNASPVSAQ